MFLYESAAKIGEVLGLKISDVEFDKYGAVITLPDAGKTGARHIRIIASSPAISNWLLEHPKKNDKNAFLFCGLWGPNKGEELQYRHVNKLLKETAAKAGIDKPVNPHHFRHSRATLLAKKLTETQLCEYMGWVKGSSEAATYVHLSGRDFDHAILEMHGLIEGQKELSKLKPRVCPRCNLSNDPAARFCSGCSLGLDEESMREFDQQKEIATKIGFDIQLLLKDPDFKAQMMNMMAE